MTSGVAVVIPNFNGAAVLPGCLRALAAQSVPPAEVIVVDNGSSDGSADRARDDLPGVNVMRLGQNTGFAGGANRGVAAVSAERVAVLNSDAEPASDWLATIASAPAPGDVWAWGSVLVDERGRIESAGDCYAPGGFAFKAAQGADPADLPEEPYEAFAPPGAAPVFRRDVFLDLGGYDEGFFLYYEDVDLAFRARLRGWRALMLPGARVRHRLGASGDRRATRRYVARNALTCAVLNLPDLRPGVLALNARRELRAARRGGYVAPYLSGRAAGVARLPSTLVRRRARQRERTVAAERIEAAYGLPPVIAPLGPEWP